MIKGFKAETQEELDEQVNKFEQDKELVMPRNCFATQTHVTSVCDKLFYTAVVFYKK